jgi:hypothetical protein
MVITTQLPNEERLVEFLTSSQFSRGTHACEMILVIYFHSLYLRVVEWHAASIFVIPRFIVLDYLILSHTLSLSSFFSI